MSNCTWHSRSYNHSCCYKPSCNIQSWCHKLSYNIQSWCYQPSYNIQSWCYKSSYDIQSWCYKPSYDIHGWHPDNHEHCCCHKQRYEQHSCRNNRSCYNSKHHKQCRYINWNIPPNLPSTLHGFINSRPNSWHIILYINYF
ncbi:unnamed protein product [Boreogadus saida]